MLPESLGSWGDWTVMTKATMRTMVAVRVRARRGAGCGARALSLRRLRRKMAEPVVETIADAFQYLSERRSFCTGARSVPVAACLHSVETWRAAQASDGLNQRPHVHTGMRGGADLLAENNVHFDILNEGGLGNLDEYEIMVVSEAEYVSPATCAALRKYVSGGGVLIAMGEVSLRDSVGRRLPNFALADLFGADYVEESPFSVEYIDRLSPEIAEGLPEMPLLLQSGAAARGHRAASQSALPASPRDGGVGDVQRSDLRAGYGDRQAHLSHALPARAADGVAGGAPQRARRGPCNLCGRAAGLRLQLHAVSVAAQAFGNLLSALDRPQRLRVDGPPGTDIALMQQGKAWRLHVIRRAVESHGSAQSAESLYTHGVRVTAHKPGIRAVRSEPEGLNIPFEARGGAVSFTLPPFRDWTIVSIE